jgi:hypothetical protein
MDRPELTFDQCDDIFDRMLNCATEKEFLTNLDFLIPYYKFISVELGKGSMFWRARALPEGTPRFNGLSEMSCPPAALVKEGRLNGALHPCLYLSNNRMTALAEISATRSQFVQLAGFRIAENRTIRLASIGYFSDAHKGRIPSVGGPVVFNALTSALNDLPEYCGHLLLYIDRFLFDIISETNAYNTSYLKSRALSKAIYQKSGALGIIYPSVKPFGGTNLAFKQEFANGGLKNHCCNVVEITESRRYGLVTFKRKYDAMGLDEKLNFIWSDAKPDRHLLVYGLENGQLELAKRNAGDPNAWIKTFGAGA